MIEITFTEADGTVRLVATEASGTLMNAALAGGVKGILAECGGTCSCGTCHVHVDPEWSTRLPPPAGDEEDMLSLSDQRSDHSRLSCQIALSACLNGLLVALPERQG